MSTNPQRLAWATLLAGLVLFCSLCISTIFFTRWLLLESPTQLHVTLKVGRGTVGLAAPDSADEKAVRTSTSVDRADRLSTDSVSQGFLVFSDNYSGDVIATVTLRNDSQITLSNATRPRFSLSDKPYILRLTGLNGRADVWVRSDLDREIRLDIEGSLGTVRIGGGGRFLVDSNPASLKVTVREGGATLVSRADRQTKYLDPTGQGYLTAETPQIQIIPAPLDLLSNSSFVQAGPEGWPVGWICAFYPSPQYPNATPGEHKFITIQGRPAIHIQRLQPNPEPGEVGCEQTLAGPEGLDVTQYDSLRLRASMMIQYQKLSACGVAGSECPVMLYLHYVDQQGIERHWYHGFFAQYTPGEGRTRCDSCLEEHERVNQNAWYTYESGNLFTDLPEDQRPASIISARFYAGGHEFDVMLNEVALLATLPQPDPSGTAAAP